MLPRSLLSFKEINGIRSLVLELGTMAQCLSSQQLRGWGRRITSSGRPAWRPTLWGLHWLKNKGEKEKLKTQLFVVNHRRKFKVYYMGRHEHGGTVDRHGRHRSAHTVVLMSPNVSPGPRHFPSLTSSRQNTSYRTSVSVNELEEQCW